MTRSDDENGVGDSTEVVSYEEALRRRPLSAPTTLGRYRLERLLAQGGMAEVWLGTAEGPGRFAKKVVVKRIRPSLVKQAHEAASKNVEMFVREARLLASLEHKNIVQVIEFGAEPSKTPDRPPEHFIVLEYLEGLTLRDLALRVWQTKRPLPMEVVVRAIADLCDGLEHAHQLRDERGTPANLVHRDISPDNLFVTNAGVAKLLDFGIAKRADWSNLTVAGEIKGKVPYMSPEQLKGERIDARTDIFALGVVLAWLLTGRRPFDGPSDIFTMKAILDDAPRPLRALNPKVPEPLERLVLACLEKDPAKRMPSAAKLGQGLRALFSGQQGDPAAVGAVVVAASTLPPTTYEIVPDVAAVPVARFVDVTAPVQVMASRGVAPLPDSPDLSVASTEQMRLDGKLAAAALAPNNAIATSPEREAPRPPLAALDATDPRLRAPAPDAATLRPVLPATSPGDDADPETLQINALSDLPSAPPEEIPSFRDPEPAGLRDTVEDRGPSPPLAGPAAPRPSWRDNVPAELRDTIDLAAVSVAPSGAPAAALAPPLATPVPVPPRRGRQGRGVSGVVAAFVGAAFAVVVLAVLAVVLGVVDDPFAVAVVDAGSAPVVVVDAGSAVAVVPVVPVVVDAGVADVVVDAGVADVVVDAGVADVVVDAGEAAPEDVPEDPALPPSKKKPKPPPPVKKKPPPPTTPTTPTTPVTANPSAKTGSLLVRARPWANVVVDGKPVGTTPFPPLTLPVGKHRVTLEQGGTTKVLAVDVKAGQTATLNVDMKAP